MNEVHCKVFVGFGGSGGKTLLALARMFAADQYWAGRCESEAYFVLVDTDQGDLAKLAGDIQRTFAAVGEHPYVKTIALAQGVTRMDTAIKAAMKPARASEKGLQRMKESWWFDQNDKPFIARNLQSPPSQGAAQCPAISYFLSWKAMQGADSLIGQAVDELCEEMRGRVREHHSAERSTRVSLNLVAGLAGGTGRGSWAPLSLRIQQELRSHGFGSFATGIFFDQSCYESIQRKTQGQRVKMIVNSLTGISELSGWIDNDLDRPGRAGKRHFVRLPSFATPQSARDDVVNSRKLLSAADEDGETAGATPVTKAYVVFANGRSGELAHNKHYHLAASALYGMSSESIIASEESNERIYLGSLGASSFRVDIDAIRDYLMDRVEFDCIRGLADAGTQGKKSRNRSASAEAVKVVEALLLPLMVDATDKGVTLVPEGAARAEPKLLVRLQAGLLAECKGAISSFMDDLEEMDPGDYEQELRRIVKRASRGKDFEAVVAGAIGEAIAHAFGPEFRREDAAGSELVEAYLQKALTSRLEDPLADSHAIARGEGDISAHVASFVVSRQVLELLGTQLGDVLHAADEVGRGGRTLEEVVKLLRKYRGRQYLVAGVRFNANERDDLQRKLKDLVLAAGRSNLRALLEKWLKPLMGQLNAWRDNLAYAVDAAEKHAMDLERAKLTQNRTEAIFTTPDELREWRRKPKDAKTVFQPDRYLEPFATEQDFEAWGQDLQRSTDARLRDALDEIQGMVLRQAMTGRRSKEEQRSVERDLYRALDSFREDIIISRKWLVDRFSMVAVAERLAHAYASEIEECKSSPKAQGYLHDHFLRLFGFSLETRRGRLQVPSAEEIIVNMATELGENCKAQYLVRSGAERMEKKSAHVFLPADEKLASDQHGASKLVAKCEKDARRRHANVNYHADPVNAGEDGGADDRGNPFLMLGMVMEGFVVASDGNGPSETAAVHAAFNQISSLDYYNKDGDEDVKTFLNWVERPDGRSIFADVSYSFGLGYILPAFVTNEGLRESRWRPWAQDVDAEMERRANAGVDAMLYAMLGIPGKGSSRVFAQRLVSEDGTKVSWGLPLIKFGGAATKNGFTFTRRAFTERTGEWRPDSRAFDGGDQATSIAKLDQLFRDQPDVPAAIAAEAAHFFGVLCFEEGIIERDVKAQFRALYDWIDGTLRTRLEKLPNYEVDYSDLVNKLEARSLELAKMKREELAELYRGA